MIFQVGSAFHDESIKQYFGQTEEFLVQNEKIEKLLISTQSVQNVHFSFWYK